MLSATLTNNLSYEEIIKLVNEVYQRTNDIQQTSTETGLSRSIVLEAVGFNDEWSFIFDDN